MIIVKNLKSLVVMILTLCLFALSTTLFNEIHPHVIVLILGGFAIGYFNPSGGFYYCLALGLLLFIILYFINNNTLKVVNKSTSSFACYLGLALSLAGGLLGKFIKNTFKTPQNDD